MDLDQILTLFETEIACRVPALRNIIEFTPYKGDKISDEGVWSGKMVAKASKIFSPIASNAHGADHAVNFAFDASEETAADARNRLAIQLLREGQGGPAIPIPTSRADTVVVGLSRTAGIVALLAGYIVTGYMIGAFF